MKDNFTSSLQEQKRIKRVEDGLHNKRGQKRQFRFTSRLIFSFKQSKPNTYNGWLMYGGDHCTSTQGNSLHSSHDNRSGAGILGSKIQRGSVSKKGVILFNLFHFAHFHFKLTRPLVGSSRNKIDGLATTSTAIESRFFCSKDSPPDKSSPTCKSCMSDSSNIDKT